MTDLLNEDLISYDPLSEVTRKERRALLGISVLGVALVKVPLVPEKLSTFGIEFARPKEGLHNSQPVVLGGDVKR